ncbi:MAG: hypothetical protein A2X24_09985, partial [Chloroflexi bacterium GWB2_54_36]
MTFQQFIKGLAVSLLILVVIIAGLLAATGLILKNGAQKAMQPVEQASNYLSTQVTNVLHPTPTVIPDPVTILREVRSLARLETVQYSMEKVITTEVGQGALGFLFGDRLLFVAHGEVIAGIDLEKLGADQMWVENGVLMVRLPEAEIFVATLDNQLSYVYDRETGILKRGDVTLESLARKAAEDEIEKAAVADGILDTAQKNAESYLYRLLRQLGFQE